MTDDNMTVYSGDRAMHPGYCNAAVIPDMSRVNKFRFTLFSVNKKMYCEAKISISIYCMT